MTSLHADEAFLGHFQLNHDPFAPRVPGFKFFPAQRKPVLGQLHHLARYSQLLLVVTGPLGSGKTLLRHLAKIACANDCGRFEWSVLDWNTPAIDFYKSLGAQPQEEWVRYRMDGKVLREFAEGN